MDTKKTISVFGAGFVGGECYKAFSKLQNYNVLAYDSNAKDCRLSKQLDKVNFATFEEAASADVCFIALPTPMNIETGECDISLIQHCVANIRNLNKENIIVIKSTVVPGTTKKLGFSYNNIFFNPEFLTEANAEQDFKNLQYQIIGTNEDSNLNQINILVNLFKDCYSQEILNCTEIYVMDSSAAELVKYTRNCYLATRLSFFNEIKQICDSVDVNYEIVAKYAGLDPRVGTHYNKVGFPKGWGLSCFPKDLNAIKHLATKLGIKPLMLQAAWDKNLEVRPPEHRDWEKMNKAVVKK